MILFGDQNVLQMKVNGNDGESLTERTVDKLILISDSGVMGEERG